MTATVIDTLPEGDRWLYEVKLDGYRALIIKSGDRVELRSRNEKDLTKNYPSVTAAAQRLTADSAVIDGDSVGGGGGRRDDESQGSPRGRDRREREPMPVHRHRLRDLCFPAISAMIRLRGLGSLQVAVP